MKAAFPAFSNAQALALNYVDCWILFQSCKSKSTAELLLEDLILSVETENTSVSHKDK